jgi:hypothetical protein
VTIYMLDSGIKTSHQEFQPWGSAGSPGSSRAQSGPDFVDDDDDAGTYASKSCLFNRRLSTAPGVPCSGGVKLSMP